MPSPVESPLLAFLRLQRAVSSTATGAPRERFSVRTVVLKPAALPRQSFRIARLPSPTHPLPKERARCVGCRPRSPTVARHRPGQRGHSPNLPGFFHPGNVLELSPSRLSATRRSRRVSAPHPSVSFDAELSRRVRLRRVDPSGQPDTPRFRADIPCLPDVLPFGVLPPAAVAPASRRFLSCTSPDSNDAAVP